MKKCSKCNEDKPLTLFYKDKNGKGGHRAVCADCDIRKAKIWNVSNKEAHVEHERRHRTDNKDSVKSNKQKYITNNPKSIKNSALKFSYGITIEQYQVMLKSQQESCAICNINQSELTKALCVDHCHKTGKIRALLCRQCNSALGFIKENIEAAQKLVEYIKIHNEVRQ